jgi:two-component system osmolarity sensor histidine kinase EnvZ
LRSQHHLQVRLGDVGPGVDEWHPPFFYLLEDALALRLGRSRHLVRATGDDGQPWYRAQVEAGGRLLSVGMPAQRVPSQPLAAVLGALVLGLAVAGGLALVLARRVVAPLMHLQRASERVGLGETPELLPEEGPRELVMLSRSFNRMAVQVRELLAARTLMLAGVSHDLRTPLARMRLALELLREQPDHALIDRLERDIDHMNRLIANVLDLARGVAREVSVPVHVTQLLSGLAQPFGSGGRVRLLCEMGGCDLPEMAVHRAMTNLLENALRYAPQGMVDLVCEPCGSGLRLGVLDRGPGIPPDRVATMLEPFQRLDESRSPANGGAGLGLAIVKALAQAHGWQLLLQPREGGGMEAWIKVP